VVRFLHKEIDIEEAIPIFSNEKKHPSGHVPAIVATAALSALFLCSACSAGTEVSARATEAFPAYGEAVPDSYAAYCHPLRDGEEIRTPNGKGLILRSITDRNGFFYLVFGATTDFDGKLVVDRDATVVYDGRGGRFGATSVKIGNRTTTERTIVSGTETPVEIEFSGRPDFSTMWPRVDLGIDGETLVVRNFRAYAFAGENEPGKKTVR